MARENARQLFGSTNKSSCVPSGFPSYAHSDAGEQTACSRAARSCGIPAAVAHSSSSKSLSRGLCGQYLADALMVWDCYERAPRTDCPILLRFENCDYVASSHNQELVMEPQRGGTFAVTSEQVNLESLSVPDDLHSRAQGDCLVWLPAREFSSALGQQVINVFNDTQGAAVIVLEDCYIRLKPAGSTVNVFLSRY